MLLVACMGRRREVEGGACKGDGAVSPPLKPVFYFLIGRF